MAGFDPNQPRDEEGKWTEASRAAWEAAGLISPETDPESSIWWGRIEELAPTIADAPLEHLYILDKNGNILEKVDGGSASVTTTDEQNNLARDNVLFHNHPYNLEELLERRNGLSHARFSDGDLIYAFHNRSSASAVVSGDYLVGIQFPESTVRNLLSQYRGYSDNIKIELLLGQIEDYVASKVAKTLKTDGRKGDLEAFLEGNYIVKSTDILDAMAEGYEAQGIKFWWKKWR